MSDRRGSPLALGGMGLAGVGVVLLFTYLTGGDVLGTLFNIVAQEPALLTQEDAPQYEGIDAYETFAATVLGSTDDYWSNAFAAQGKTYATPTLVLFRQGTQSACGGASSMSGPHYCPLDSKIYLDETFFEELQSRFGARGGDVAEAYVIAHEVGHHVQNQLGLLGESQSSNEKSIETELQADCFAGLWAGSLKDAAVFEQNEFVEATDAAASVGDDNIQQQTSGTINPESWTHGSSEERIAALQSGYNATSIESCL